MDLYSLAEAAESAVGVDEVEVARLIEDEAGMVVVEAEHGLVSVAGGVVALAHTQHRDVEERSQENCTSTAVTGRNICNASWAS